MKHYEMDGHAVGLMREERGISRPDLAEKCDVTPAYITLLENGDRQPSASVALKIASALGVRFADITRTKGLEAAEVSS